MVKCAQGGLSPDSEQGLSRRDFLILISASTGGLVLGFPENATSAPVENQVAANTVPVSLIVNGKRETFNLDPRVTLLDLLRENLGLTGTKKGCDHGQCGACTILADGRRINSCLALAVSHDGAEITTVEGLKRDGDLDPMQAAFIEHDGFQCGYCTPGQLCSAVALLTEAQQGNASFVTPDLSELGPAQLTDDEIRERMSGNICRCGAYPGILAAVKAAMQSRILPTGRTKGQP